MSIFQVNACTFHYKSIKYKKAISCLVLFFCLFHLIAQEEGNIKLKIDTGILWDWVDGEVYLSGSFLYIEPKLKVSDKSVLGLRIGVAYNTQIIQTLDTDQFYIDNYADNDNGIFSFIPTLDYHFRKKGHRPYLGIGLGYYFLTSAKKVFVISSPNNNARKVVIQNQIGLLLRSGVNLYNFKIGRMDLSKIIIGLEFNFIPKADVETADRNRKKVGTINTSNIALSIGYTFGNKLK